MIRNMKKAITLEEVGEMLSHVVKHMATKDDLAELKEELKAEIQGVDTKLSAQIKALDSRFGAHENHELDKRMQLEVRVGKLEKKVFARK